jgi:tetratricopeptide (TPR) repeat protein
LKLLIAAALCAAAAPAAADPLPKPEAIALPEERPLLDRFLQALGRPATATEARVAFDALLADLPQPTPFRGLVQFFRAAALGAEDRQRDAEDAVAESIRLLPQYSAPLLLASQLSAFNDRADMGSDYLIRASRIDPSIVSQLGDYEVGNILRRLGEANDRKRTLALSERLLEIGWNRGSYRTVSSMAMNVIEARVDRGDAAGAAALVPKIVSPDSFARLMTEKKFDPLAAAVEAWAGRSLEKQGPIFLDQAQAEWEASNDFEAGLGYARALASAGHDRTLVATFLPLFHRPMDPEQFQLLFIAVPVANALARQGRWDEALGVFDKALATWPEGETANALNLTANRGRLLFFRGDFAGALAQLDKDLANAAKWGGQVNIQALTTMHLYRACALEQLGRRPDAVTSSAIVTGRKAADPTGFAYLQLCRDDPGFARAALMQALGEPETRDQVIAWIQPTDEETFDSPFARTMAEKKRQLKADEALIAAVAKYGRILPRPINASAPPEEAPTSASAGL